MNSFFDYLLRKNDKWLKEREHNRCSPNKMKRERLEEGVFNQLKKLIRSSSSESEIHSFLENNRMIFAYLLKIYNTANHGFDVRSKQQITCGIKDKNKGSIPDFIIGGENSDGWQWWIIELKGADEKIFTDKEPFHFSYIANCGICQLFKYVSDSNKIQSYLRDHLRMVDFSNPKGILIIGREEELTSNKEKQALKRTFNYMGQQFQIKTYDWLLRELEKIVDYP